MRGPRQLATDGIYHLIARSNNGVAACHGDGDYLELLSRLLRYSRPAQLQIYHYALMQTHFHLLAYVPDTRVLAPFFKSTLISYWHYYSRQYGYRGHLWNSRFRSIAIDSDAHLLQCSRYIEVNPVHAGVVTHPHQYRWTSYRCYADHWRDPLVQLNPLFANYSPTEYRRFVEGGIDHEYQRLKKSAHCD